jgi:hypothetical protein
MTLEQRRNRLTTHFRKGIVMSVGFPPTLRIMSWRPVFSCPQILHPTAIHGNVRLKMERFRHKSIYSEIRMKPVKQVDWQHKMPSFCRHWSVLPIVSLRRRVWVFSKAYAFIGCGDGDVAYGGYTVEGIYSIMWNWNHGWYLIWPHINRDYIMPRKRERFGRICTRSTESRS